MVEMRDIGEYVERINDACRLCDEAPNFEVTGKEGEPCVFKRSSDVILITNDTEELFACVSYIWQVYKRYRLGIIDK